MTARGAACVEMARQVLKLADTLDPHETDIVVSAIVNHLRSWRPEAVSPLGLGPPTEPIRDPRRVP